MGIKTNNLGSKDRLTGHKWVLYSNPRNGRIQVNACQRCGTMMVSVRAAKRCNPKHSKNPMESIGWIAGSRPTEEQAQGTKAEA